MPARGERLVEADLVGRQRLDLDDLVGAVRLRRAARRCAFASAASRAQWTVPPAAVTDASSSIEVLVEVAQRCVLDRRAGLAQLLPVGQLGDDRRALAADRRRSPCAGCARSWASASATRGAPAGKPPLDGSSRRSSVAARISARCIGAHAGAAGGAGRRRCASGTSCRRRRRPRRRCSSTRPHLVGQHRRRGVGVLHRERAAEAAALLGARAARPARCPRTARSSRSGASPTREHRAASGRSGGR